MLRYSARQYSQVRHKLAQYTKTGHVDRLVSLKGFQPAPISLQKLLLQLQQRYDAHKWQYPDGRGFSIAKLRPSDLKTDSDKAKVLFDNLVQFKRLAKTLPPPQLMTTLLGVTTEQLKDEFVVTKSVAGLLKRDGDSARAEYLARMAGAKGTVAMNQIMQWHLERGKIDDAMRCFNNRKKWNIPANDQTYIILFTGLARSVEWGKASAALVEKAQGIYDRVDLHAENKTATFNALLSLVVKNFDDNQRLAWDLFDKVIPDAQGKVEVIPDCQLFTVLLNGVKKKIERSMEAIRNDRHMAVTTKQEKISELEARLISTAELIYSKVVKGATPPVPPTEAEANEDPGVLALYRQKSKRKLISIDEAFVSVFVSCFINKESPVQYTVRGLEYLMAFNPEIRMLVGSLGDNALKPTRQMDTDEQKTLPLAPLNFDKVNPMVVFPPPATLKNKKRAIFSNKRKPLVDFTRPNFDDIRATQLDKQYQITKGRFGKKLPPSKSARISAEPSAPKINRFHLQLIIDALLKLGRINEFESTMWYVLLRYGDIRLPKENDNALPSVPSLEDVVPPMKTEPVSGEISGFVEGAIDIGLVENFIFKMNTYGRKHGQLSIQDIVTMFAALVNPKYNPNRELEVRLATIDGVFAALVTTLHYYHDYTMNELKKQKVPNVPRKLITDAQLKEFMSAFVGFIDLLVAHYSGERVNPTYLLPNYNIDLFNKIIDRLYNTTWMKYGTVVPMDERDQTLTHRYIIKAGILHYTPRALQNPLEKLTLTEIAPSITAVYNNLKDRDDLSKDEAQLMVKLRSLLQLRTNDQANQDKLRHLRSAIRQIV